jgi:hypothetical protein
VETRAVEHTADAAGRERVLGLLLAGPRPSATD